MLEPGLNRMWRQPFPEVCCHLLPGLPSHPSHADNLSVQLRLNTLQQAVLPRCIPSLLNYILDLENGFCALRHLRLDPLGQRSPAGTLQSWLQAQKHLAVKNPTSAYVSLRLLSGPHLRGIVGAKGCSCSRVVESADAEVMVVSLAFWFAARTFKLLRSAWLLLGCKCKPRESLSVSARKCYF